MGVMPVGRLLLSVSLPIMISMLIQALYNIVDSMFVARISEDALTAVSLAFPLQNLMIAIAVGTGVGMNALLSRKLGERDFAAANSAATHGLFLQFCNYVAFLIIGLLVSRSFFEMQIKDQTIIQYGFDYMIVVTTASFGIFGGIAYERLLQSTGKTILSMIAQATGAIINIVLDPIMIFGYFGLPAMGVTGAALATVIGQVGGFVVGLILHQKFNHEVRVQLRGFRPKGQIIKNIYAVGVPSALMGSVGSVMTFGMNRILLVFSSTAAAVFGIYFKLQSFVFMPVFGLNNGMVPILAYNYGARKRERMVKTIRTSILFAVCIMLVGFAAFQIFPEQILTLFNASPDMMQMGERALRLISWHFILAGFCIVASSVFQALGRAVYSLIMSLLRQLVVLLPAAYLLSLTGNIDNVWFAFPIAEACSTVLSASLLLRVYRQIIQPMPDAPKTELEDEAAQDTN